MRRCLHACLIGVLTLTLSTDAARGCWFLRQACRGPRHVVVCPPVAVPGPWQVAAEIDSVQASGGWEPVPGDDEASCDCCSGVGFESESMAVESDESDAWPVEWESVVASAADEPPLTEQGTVVAAETVTAPVPTLAEPVAPAEAPAPAAAVAERSPPDDVRQAVALDEPAKSQSEVVLPAEPSMEEDVPEEPAAPVATEGNIFDEVDRGVVGPDDGPAVPEPSNLDAEPSAVDSTPVEKPAAPADPFDAAKDGPREPVRRWIDSTGGYAVVGTLRAVRDDGICVLQTEGRTIEVAIEALSTFDRGYAAAAAERFAAAAGPETRDTAGL